MQITMGTLKYIISITFIALTYISSAQDKLERQKFIRIGTDVSRFALPYVHDFGLSGAEFSIDGEVRYDLFPTIEAGFNKISDLRQEYNENNELTYEHNYQLEGNYIRIGLNYNMINYRHRLDRNLFFIGARFAMAKYSHKADDINIENNWGAFKTNLPETKLSNQWFESVIGIRGEILKNLYMGYTIRIKTILNDPDYGSFKPFWIPGYGKSTKNWSMGMSYSIFYAIPIKNPKLDFEY